MAYLLDLFLVNALMTFLKMRGRVMLSNTINTITTKTITIVTGLT